MKTRTLTYCAAFALLAGLAACTDVELDEPGVNADNLTTLSGDFSRTLVVGDFLYGVDNESVLTYDITDRTAPALVDRTPVGLAVETIYHHEGNLFIGSRSGMYIYAISRSGVPVRRGDYQYSDLPGIDEVQPCDPVVAEGNTAYASVYTSDDATDGCGRVNTFQNIVVLDVSNLDRPSVVNLQPASTPRGLAIDGDLLFVCNNENGMTVYDVTDRTEFQWVAHFGDVNAWDAIAGDGRLVVVAADEVVQYDYTDPANIVELSRVDLPQL